MQDDLFLLQPTGFDGLVLVYVKTSSSYITSALIMLDSCTSEKLGKCKTAFLFRWMSTVPYDRRDAWRLHTIRATAFYHHHKEHPCHCCLWEAPLCTLAATCVHNRLGFQTQIIYMKGKAPVYVQPAPLCMPVGKYLFQYFKKQWVSTYFCAMIKAHSIKQVQIQFPLTGKCNKW